MFSDEKMLLDLRLNTLNSYVDKFIIAEAKYLHNGKPKKLNFNINDFSDFKNKIEYIIVKDQPTNIFVEEKDETFSQKEDKKILNSINRDNYQREQLGNNLKNLDDNDIIIISDLDEIPNLENINFHNLGNKILIFKQKMFYYKLNLHYQNFVWFGSKAISKKKFISPQWLRNIKTRKYPFWRVDTYFSNKKYNNIQFIEDGGWHFTCIKKPEDIHKKLLSFAHHQDYENAKISLEDLKQKINQRKVLYDHAQDKKNQNKWTSEEELKKIDIKELPKYVEKNFESYKEWLE